MTFLGLDLDTSARLAGLAAVLLAFLSAGVGLLAWKWNDAAQAAKDRQNATFREDSSQSISEANRRASSAETELETVKRQLAPRTLPDEQYERLVSLLSEAPAKGSVRVGWVNTSEPAAYGRRLGAALVAAGWTIETTLMIDISAVGVFVVVRDLTNPQAHAEPLRRALVDAGVDVKGVQDAQIGQDRPTLLIGEKPQ